MDGFEVGLGGDDPMPSAPAGDQETPEASQVAALATACPPVT
jgi:hypothetical protein